MESAPVKPIRLPHLAALILTRNEEANIADAVANARLCADEVVIIDSGSTDRTVELAQQAGARAEFRAWDDDYAAARNFALQVTGAEWVLFLDADERLDEKAVQAVRQAVSCAEKYQWSLTRRTAAMGHLFRFGALRPDRVLRLFPKASVLWTGKVHETPVCSLPVKMLAGTMRHYSYRSWPAWIQKMDRYTTIWADEAYKKNRRASPAAAILRSGGGFAVMYFLRLGFLDGLAGLVFCVLHAFYTLMKYLKLAEKTDR